MPAGVGVLIFRRLPKAYRILGMYFVLAVMLETVCIVLALSSVNNLPFVHLFALIECVVFLHYFASLEGQNLARRITNFVAIALGIYMICNSIWNEPIYTFNSMGRLISGFVLAIACIRSLINMFWSDTETFMPKQPEFLVTAGATIYFLGSIMVIGAYDYLIENDIGQSRDVWHIHSVLLILFHLLIALGLWRSRTLKYH